MASDTAPDRPVCRCRGNFHSDRCPEYLANCEALDRHNARRDEAERLARAASTADHPGLTYLAGELQAALDEARAEVERMRPVVEAAETWRAEKADAFWRVPLIPEAQALVDAVDAYRAGRPAAAAAGTPEVTSDGQV